MMRHRIYASRGMQTGIALRGVAKFFQRVGGFKLAHFLSSFLGTL